MCTELCEALNIVLFFCDIYFSNECYSKNTTINFFHEILESFLKSKNLHKNYYWNYEFIELCQLSFEKVVFS